MVTPVTSSELPFDNSPWIIPVYKDSGVSSYDVIRNLKRPIFNLLGKGKGRRKLKVGHFGTLDPFAEGILLVGTGKALKMVQYFQNDMSKTYEGVGTFDFSTDTGDLEGQRIGSTESKGPVGALDRDVLNQQAATFVGPYLQKPPYFSAVKHEGRPLYDWAREGVFIDKPAVEREVFSFEILRQLEDNTYEFRTRVSSGTYIRGLWHEFAHKMGLPGHLRVLKRVGWGDYCGQDALKLPIESLKDEDLKLVTDFWDLPLLNLNERQSEYFTSGRYLETKVLEGPVERYQWVLGPRSELLGLGVPICVDGRDFLKVEVNLT
jgi:tRNA pseudouridine55 synthase